MMTQHNTHVIRNKSIFIYSYSCSKSKPTSQREQYGWCIDFQLEFIPLECFSLFCTTSETLNWLNDRFSILQLQSNCTLTISTWFWWCVKSECSVWPQRSGICEKSLIYESKNSVETVHIVTILTPSKIKLSNTLHTFLFGERLYRIKISFLWNMWEYVDSWIFLAKITLNVY